MPAALYVAVAQTRDNYPMTEVLMWAVRPRGLSPTQHIVLIHLARMADARNRIDLDVPSLSEMAGVTPVSVERAIVRLESREIITRRKSAVGRPDTITINAPISLRGSLM